MAQQTDSIRYDAVYLTKGPREKVYWVKRKRDGEIWLRPLRWECPLVRVRTRAGILLGRVNGVALRLSRCQCSRMATGETASYMTDYCDGVEVAEPLVVFVRT